jgi:hypothetical protein
MCLPVTDQSDFFVIPVVASQIKRPGAMFGVICMQIYISALYVIS